MTKTDSSDNEDRVRGVLNDAPLESPALLQQKLQELDLELAKSCNGILLKCSADFLQPWKLVYLRKTLFQVEQAATQLLEWLQLHEQFFGPTYLQQRVGLHDLDKETSKLLRSGCFQILPSRDTVGRRICIFLEDAYKQNYSVAARIKLTVFLMSQLSDDVQTQQQGFVMVTKKKGGSSAFFVEDPSFTRLLQCLPLRCTADHVWSAGHDLRVARGLVPLSSQDASSIRVHTSTDTLAEYGILEKDLPLTSSGTLKTNNWNNIVKYWRAAEHYERRLSPVQPGMECPSFQQVVFRHVGGPSSVSMAAHPPNKVFRSLLIELLGKDDIVTEAIQQARQLDYSFFSWDHKQCWYVPVDGKVLHSLVAHAVKEQVRAGERSAAKKRPRAVAVDSKMATVAVAESKKPVAAVSVQKTAAAPAKKQAVAQSTTEDASSRVLKVVSQAAAICRNSNISDDDDDSDKRSSVDDSIDDSDGISIDSRRQHKRPRYENVCLQDTVNSSDTLVGAAGLVALNMALHMKVLEREKTGSEDGDDGDETAAKDIQWKRSADSHNEAV